MALAEHVTTHCFCDIPKGRTKKGLGWVSETAIHNKPMEIVKLVNRVSCYYTFELTINGEVSKLCHDECWVSCFEIRLFLTKTHEAIDEVGDGI
jgi:hypothetical protein